MGLGGFFIGKLIIGATSALMLVGGTLLIPVCPPASVVLIEGAAAGATMLVSPVDPVSAFVAVATGPV